MTEKKSYAVIGGGLAGLSSAYHMAQLNPEARITVFEKGTADTYNASSDNVGRASLSASPARTMRYTGATAGAGQWVVQETKAMLDTLQSDMQADPASYPGLENKKLLTPQPTVIIGPSKEDAFYCKSLETITSSGATFEEIDGATLKSRFPGLYNTLSDNAAALVEAPASTQNPSGVAGIIDVESTLKALSTYLKKKGVDMRNGEQVLSVSEGNGNAIVTTAAQPHTYDSAIIAPGQWIENLVDTKQHGIEIRYDRVVVLDIDLKGLGIETKALPFTKGLSPKGGKGSMYSFLPNAGEGRLKFVPAATMRSVEKPADLKSPITSAETEAAIAAAAIVLQVDPERLKQHASASLCAYTCPKVKENPLIAKLSDHIILNGLDSSGSARTSGGLGKIAASLSLGRDEPYADTYEKYNLAAHKALVQETPQITPQSTVQRVIHSIQYTLGL